MPIDRFICLAAGGGMMAVLLFVTSHPVPQGWDKAVHFAVFATITALLWRGTCRRAPIAVLLSVIAFGAFGADPRCARGDRLRRLRRGAPALRADAQRRAARFRYRRRGGDRGVRHALPS